MLSACAQKISNSYQRYILIARCSTMLSCALACITNERGGKPEEQDPKLDIMLGLRHVQEVLA
jgi:hypothetical protein